MYDEHLAVILELYADDVELIKLIEDGYAKADYKGAARACADLMAEQYGKPGKNVNAFEIANIYHAAGEYDLAIDWYEKCYEEHNLSLPLISVIRDPLRSYPRFQELLRKMNLPVDDEE
jgi:hypothetical protein